MSEQNANVLVKKDLRNLKIPPGPPALPVFGHLLERRKDPIGLFMRGVLEYGNVVSFDFGLKAAVLLNNPDHIKYVLQDNQKNYRKGFGYDKLRAVMGNGLINSGGDFWKRQRKLAQPAFHRQSLVEFSSIMVKSTVEMLERWEKNAKTGKPLLVTEEMMHLAVKIVSLCLFGQDASQSSKEVGDAVTGLLEEINLRLLRLTSIVENLPLPRNFRFNHSKKALDNVVMEIINERRKNPGGRLDLLSMFINAKDDETGEGMSDEHLKDEIMTIFLAGHETTANAMSWAWYLLSLSPEIQKKLKKEVSEVLGNRLATFEDLPNLKYTRMVLDETLRLYPSAWIIGREPIEDDEIGGFLIPAKTIVALSPYVTHHSPEYWENPEGFDPERFTEENSEKRKKFSYFPFGGGPRICIGSAFSMMEAQLVLATITQRYSLELVPSQWILPEPSVTLRPKNGIWMTVHPA